MPRHNRRKFDAEAGQPNPAGTVGERREEYRGEEYVVRAVTSHGATKAYRCPGCDQEVRPGVPHVVTWPADGLVGAGPGAEVEDRRHWHSPCWSARDRRRPSR